MNTSVFFKVLMIHLSLHAEKLPRTLQGESRERAVIFRRKFNNVYFFRKHVPALIQAYMNLVYRVVQIHFHFHDPPLFPLLILELEQ